MVKLWTTKYSLDPFAIKSGAHLFTFGIIRHLLRETCLFGSSLTKPVSLFKNFLHLIVCIHIGIPILQSFLPYFMAQVSFPVQFYTLSCRLFFCRCTKCKIYLNLLFHFLKREIHLAIKIFHVPQKSQFMVLSPKKRTSTPLLIPYLERGFIEHSCKSFLFVSVE